MSHNGGSYGKEMENEMETGVIGMCHYKDSILRFYCALSSSHSRLKKFFASRCTNERLLWQAGLLGACLLPEKPASSPFHQHGGFGGV